MDAVEKMRQRCLLAYSRIVKWMDDRRLHAVLAWAGRAVMVITCVALSNLVVGPACARETVHTTGGTFQIAWNRSQLTSLGIRIVGKANAQKGRFADWEMSSNAHLTAVTNDHAVYKLLSASLPVRGSFTVHTAVGKFVLDGFTLRYRQGSRPTLDVVNRDEQRLFHADHLMLEYDPHAHTVRISAMDIRVSPWLAQHMAKPQLANVLVGTARLVAPIPKALDKGQASDCPTSNRWPGAKVPDSAGSKYQVDVFMEALIAEVTGCRHCSGPGGTGQIKVTPTTILRNNVNDGRRLATVKHDPLGTSLILYAADVPWRTKFSRDCPPYGNDQHPYLIWNLYRITPAGALQPVAYSGVKHGHVAQNNECLTYPTSNHILGRGCVDVYGTGDNDAPDQLSPRREIIPFTGQWGRCGSTYDPHCTGRRGSAITYDGFKYRLLVPETTLEGGRHESAGSRYVMEAWYVVRGDANVYNSMAHRQVGFSWNATNSIWHVSNVGAVHLGPVIDEWVNPSEPTSMHRNTEIVTPKGRIRVAVKVVPLGKHTFRYQYAVMNVDYADAVTQGREPNLRITSTHGLAGFYIHIAKSASIKNVTFRDGDTDPSDDWRWSTRDDSVGWKRRGTNDLTWGRLYNFAFTTNAGPGEVRAKLVDGTAATPAKTYAIKTLGPDS